MAKHRGSLRFMIDADPDVDRPIPLEAVDQGKPWNGWRTPIVTLYQFREWAVEWGKDIGSEMHVFVDSIDDCLTLVDLGQERVEKWESLDYSQWGGIATEDLPVFRIDGWVWVEYHEQGTCDHADHDGRHSFVANECIGWLGE